MSDRRLIEEWLPIAALGIESTRERTPMTPFPAPNRLHVWWARRPLVASRAAVLASLLPAGADRQTFLHALGIHGDPVAARKRIEDARRRGTRFEGQAYSYSRAFSHSPSPEERGWIWSTLGDPNASNPFAILDPTAGGGSVPFEAMRMGMRPIANDLNPVAVLTMMATVEWPVRFAQDLESEFHDLSERLLCKREERLTRYYPSEPTADCISTNYLWGRTVRCPYCFGLVPLSPNWRLTSDGTGVRLKPHLGDGPGSPDRACSFEIVESINEQSPGTVARGTGTCPYPDCGQVIDGTEIKSQAQDGEMGEQLFAVVYKRRVKKYLKSGKRGKDKWVRGYRAPRPEDDNSAEIRELLDEKLLDWEALEIVPGERIPDGNKTTEPHRYGMTYWRDLFSPRQLLCHGTGVEVYREMLDEDREAGRLTSLRRAAYGYLALSLSKLTDYNSAGCTWIPRREVIGHTFQRHDFAFVWQYAEMAPLIVGLGYDWAIQQTGKCIKELVQLVSPDPNSDNGELFTNHSTTALPPVTITCKPGDSLDHIEDAGIDAVVMDPPYYDNVMYAELSDFFYVWLKRTAGHVFPELFRSHLTDKDNEAVANVARFQGQKGAKARAGRDYQERMASIFAECHRVLKPTGVMTLMFTHKAAGAWDALTTGLMEAGFRITASWPINTEAPGSMHIKDKAAANSTIFLVCRPRTQSGASDDQETPYWEEIEPLVARAVRKRVKSFQQAGIRGVDLYLASFGPGAGGVLAPLAPSSWPPTRQARAASSPAADRDVSRGVGSVCRHTRRRPQCRPAGGQEVAS